MIQELKKQDGTVLLELSRLERVWYCSECEKEFRGTVPEQCSCGASDKVFLEKNLPLEETGRKEYKVLGNIIYEAHQIWKDSTISMLEKDRITKNLLKRKLIVEIPSIKSKEAK